MTQAAQAIAREQATENSAVWEVTARQRLIAAADRLAARAGQPPFDAVGRTSREPRLTAKALGDLELTATLAEAVVELANQVDALKNGEPR
jgi:hypothetical protein